MSSRVSSAAVRAVGVSGELLITAGALVLLYVAYAVWGTGLETARAQDRLRETTARAWAAPTPLPDPSPTQDEASAKRPALTGYALLRMPTLGDEEWVVVDGVTMPLLAQGPGHYPETADPGELGNLAVAGHRSGHLAPFKEIDDLEPGDPVEVENAEGVWTYAVTRTIVVEPTDTWVIDPVPGEPATEPTSSMLTLTTCEPIYVANHRLVVFAELAQGPGGAAAEQVEA